MANQQENFAKAVSDYFFRKKGVDINTVSYKEMPNERRKYNLSKVIGNVNLIQGRFKIKQEVDAIATDFLSMRLP